MDLPTFRARFPEFQNVSNALITEALTAALAFVDADQWGVKRAEGVLYRAAHLLACSPWGNAARLVSKDGTSTYQLQYKQLVREIGIGMMAI